MKSDSVRAHLLGKVRTKCSNFPSDAKTLLQLFWFVFFEIVHKGDVMTTTKITLQYAQLTSPPCYINITTTSYCFSDSFTYIIGRK